MPVTWLCVRGCPPRWRGGVNLLRNAVCELTEVVPEHGGQSGRLPVVGVRALPGLAGPKEFAWDTGTGPGHPQSEGGVWLSGHVSRCSLQDGSNHGSGVREADASSFAPGCLDRHVLALGVPRGGVGLIPVLRELVGQGIAVPTTLLPGCGMPGRYVTQLP